MSKVFSMVGVVLFLGTAMTGWFSYNKVVAGEELVVAAWAQVESNMQRKYDVLPNLVETVQASAQHEKEVLVTVTEQRTMGMDRLAEEIQASRLQLGALAVGNNGPSPEQLQLAQQLQQTLNHSVLKVLAIAENYPNLKASENFIQLQSQLEGAENRINITRMQFNNAVRGYNTQIKKLPGKIIARLAGFQAKSYFAADEQALMPLKLKL